MTIERDNRVGGTRGNTTFTAGVKASVGKEERGNILGLAAQYRQKGLLNTQHPAGVGGPGGAHYITLSDDNQVT